MLVDLFKQISKDSFRKSTQHKRLPGQTILYSKVTEGSRSFKCLTEIVELDPHYRTVFYYTNDNRMKRFYLPMPYVVMGCNSWDSGSGNVWVLFSNEPSERITQLLYYPPLTNLNKSSRVCMPIRGCKNSQDLIAQFWATPFQLDHGGHAHPGWQWLQNLGGFEEWQDIKDPLQIVWSGYKMSIAAAMRMDGVPTDGKKEKVSNQDRGGTRKPVPR